jgi:outer membrane receptor protein involved in Fe transport
VIDQDDGSIAPVKVTSNNTYYGFYLADNFDLTESLSLSAAARYNIARIELNDQLGTALTGSHRYARLNPAAGLTYAFAPQISAYGSYAEANRAPTPAEFSCAGPATPCSLTNFFVADPPLDQVVTHTMEAGFRGPLMQTPFQTLHWHAGVYRTNADDDILFAASPVIGRGFFENVGKTRRQGIEASFDYESGPWLLALDYSFTEATFRDPVTLNSPDNPLADSNGQIQVVSGNRLPNIPANLFKATVGYEPFPGWTIAIAAHVAGGMYLRGDESNLNPKTGSYAVFDLSSNFRLLENIDLFVSINNLFNTKYETFGTFSPTSDVPIAEAPGASDPRSLSPAAPFAAFGGIRVRL